MHLVGNSETALQEHTGTGGFKVTRDFSEHGEADNIPCWEELSCYVGRHLFMYVDSRSLTVLKVSTRSLNWTLKPGGGQ